VVVLEKAMVSPADKNKAPTEKLALADVAAASQAPSKKDGSDKDGRVCASHVILQSKHGSN
jgi:hypothetical protein